MTIERFVWTSHALLRLHQRQLTRSDVEGALGHGHGVRQVNDGGQADWLVVGMTALGARFEVVYDHPVDGDEATARIVSAWRTQ